MRTLKIFAVATIVVLATAGLAAAGDKIQKKDQMRDQLRDGSCQTMVAEPAAVALDVVAATDEAAEKPARDRDQTRLRDGSCEDCDGGAVCDGDQTRTKKRSQASTQEQTQTQAGTQEQTQTQAQAGTQTQEQTQNPTGTQTQAGNAWDDDETGHEGDGECGDGSGQGGSGGGGH